MQDPSKFEIIREIVKYKQSTISLYDWSDKDSIQFEIEEAIYSFAMNWHNGQCSNLYSVLSSSHFQPGWSWDGCGGYLSRDIYDHLKTVFN